MEISIKKADITYLKDILNNEIEYVALDKEKIVGYLAGHINSESGYDTFEDIVSYL